MLTCQLCRKNCRRKSRMRLQLRTRSLSQDSDALTKLLGVSRECKRHQPPTRTTGYGPPPTTTTGYGPPPTTTTGYGPPPTTTTGYGPPPTTTTGYGPPPPTTTTGYGRHRRQRERATDRRRQRERATDRPPTTGTAYGPPPINGNGLRTAADNGNGLRTAADNGNGLRTATDNDNGLRAAAINDNGLRTAASAAAAATRPNHAPRTQFRAGWGIHFAERPRSCIANRRSSIAIGRCFTWLRTAEDNDKRLRTAANNDDRWLRNAADSDNWGLRYAANNDNRWLRDRRRQRQPGATVRQPHQLTYRWHTDRRRFSDNRWLRQRQPHPTGYGPPASGGGYGRTVVKFQRGPAYATGSFTGTFEQTGRGTWVEKNCQGEYQCREVSRNGSVIELARTGDKVGKRYKFDLRKTELVDYTAPNLSCKIVPPPPQPRPGIPSTYRPQPRPNIPSNLAAASAPATTATATGAI